MKTFLPVLVLLLPGMVSTAQITTPQVKANFGIDADLRDNYIYIIASAGNDDWFVNGNSGLGKFVIDTSGAAAINAEYLVNPASRNRAVIRNMSYGPFTIANNKMLIDAVFVRDFHGDDSTIFASGSNKNGMSPANWSTPIAQSVPDKNEILDIYMHVRRDGKFATDSLWMFGAVSIENTTGNRYFDFEMFQTDILYNRNSLSFSGYGPDAGHTSWEFDEMGNITKAGDIILTAEYSSSSLSLIEARIWVNRSALSVTPVAFNWSGLFDGAGSGSEFGYASILPKTDGAFYSGLQNSGNSWGGSFGIVRGDNSLASEYTARQFMEFSVNLTKLGLDPVTMLGGSTCAMPFRKVMVKTRASTSFTAALKDFVAPFGLMDIPKVNLFTTIPIFCGVNGVSNLTITNPVSNSVYNWETLNGNFSDTSDKTSVYVDQPGTYIVHQRLNSACPVYSTDTITIDFNSVCGILLNSKLSLTGAVQQGGVQLSWNALKDENVNRYVIERSADGIHFSPVKSKAPGAVDRFSEMDYLSNYYSSFVYYRIAVDVSGTGTKFSPAIKINLKNSESGAKVTIAPNPVKDFMQAQVLATDKQTVHFSVLDANGNEVYSLTRQVEKGNSTVFFPGFETRPPGIYTLKAVLNNEVLVKRFLVTK